MVIPNQSVPPGGQAGAQTPGGRSTQTPGGAGPDPVAGLNQAVLDMTGHVKALHTNIAALTKLMLSFGDTSSKAFRESSTEMRNHIRLLNDNEELMEHILGTYKKFGSMAPDVKSWKDAKRWLSDLDKTFQHFSKGHISKDHKKELDRIHKAVEEINGEVEKYQKVSKKGFDAKVFADMSKEMEGVVRQFAQMSAYTQKSKLTGWRRNLSDAHQLFSHVTGRRNGAAVGERYKEVSNHIKLARAARNSGRVLEFEQHKKDLAESFKHITHTAKGNKRKKALTEGDEQKIQGASYEAARKKGWGHFGAKLAAKDAANTASGRTSGWMTKAGMNVLARGEGSIMKGIGSGALNMMEGGASGALGIMGEAAPIIGPFIAMGAMVKSAFDKNVKMNAEVSEKLGGAGIYTGADHGGGPISGIENVRKNMQPGFYNKLGIGYEKNLAIANQLSEAGFGLSNLSEGYQGRDPINDFSKDASFGSVQHNVYAYGKMAGLNPDQTMSETIKLIGQYKQSLGSTEDFFLRIAKDSKTAGITTQKYIGILDDVNSHYDRSNKLLESTVDIMRMLSVTGRNTAEDLKESMDTITNGGQKHSLPVKAFLNMEMMKDKDLSSRNGGMLNMNYQDALANVAKALGPEFSGEGIGKGIKGLGDFNQLLLQAQQKYGSNSLAFQTASGAITKARDAYLPLQNFNADKGGGTNGAVRYTASQMWTGENATNQAMETLTGIEQAMKHGLHKHSISELMTNPTGVMGDMGVAQAMQTMEIDPAKQKKALDLLADSPFARMDIAKQGLSKEDTDHPETKGAQDKRRILQETFAYLQSKGAAIPKLKGQSDIDALKVFANRQDGQSKMMELLPKWENTFRDIFASPALREALRSKSDAKDKQDAIEKSKQLTADTRPTADIYASAFEYLFNKLMVPLDYISRGIAMIPGVHMGGPSAQSLDELKSVMASEAPKNAIGHWQEQIDDLNAQKSTAKDNKAKDAIDGQIAGLQWNVNLGNRVSQAGQNDELQFLPKEVVDTYLSKVKYDESQAMTPKDINSLLESATAKWGENLGVEGTVTQKSSGMTDDQFADFAQKAIKLGGNGFSVKEDMGKDGKVRDVHIINNHYNYHSVAVAADPKAQAATATQADSGEKTTPQGVAPNG